MKAQTGGVAILLATFVIGVLVGFGCRESQSQSHAQGTTAEGATKKSPASETPASETPSVGKAKKIERHGAVIGLKPAKKDYYNDLHAHPWPEINALIKKCNIQNYTIYEVELDGKLYLFAYFEYTGDDYKADMAKMAADPTMKRWWAETDPCQIRLPGTPDGEQWLAIPEVYRLD